MLLYILFVAILALSSANESANKTEKNTHLRKSYVCPPNFLRISYKCYYFSNRTASWQEAYWKCRDMHSNIATIKNTNQDKILRRTLDHDDLVPLERWIGGRYDWGTKSWKWAASGNPVQYNGFVTSEIPPNKESFDWHCIFLDPTKKYKWSSSECTEQKNYICQTKIRTVNSKGKKKIQKQYNSKLNEVLVPEINSNYLNNENKHYDLNAFAMRPHETRVRKHKNDFTLKSINGTIMEVPRRRRGGKGNRKRRNKNKGKDGNTRRQRGEKMRWKTYQQGTESPFHPRVVVEEFSYS